MMGSGQASRAKRGRASLPSKRVWLAVALASLLLVLAGLDATNSPVAAWALPIEADHEGSRAHACRNRDVRYPGVAWKRGSAVGRVRPELSGWTPRTDVALGAGQSRVWMAAGAARPEKRRPDHRGRADLG